MAESSFGDEDNSVGPALSPMQRARRASVLSIGKSSSVGMISEVLTPSGSPSEFEPLATPSSSAPGNELGGFRRFEPPKSIPDTQARRIKARSNSRGRAEVTASIAGHGEGAHKMETRSIVPMERDRNGGGRGEVRGGSLRRRVSIEFSEDSGDEEGRHNVPTARYIPHSEDLDWEGEGFMDLERIRRHSRSRSEGSSSYASGSYLTSEYDSNFVPSEYSSLMTSNFDSSTTFAGGSEFASVSTAISQRTGSILDSESPWAVSSEHIQRHHQHMQHRSSLGSVGTDEHINTTNGASGSFGSSWTKTPREWAKVPLSAKHAVNNYEDQGSFTPPDRGRRSGPAAPQQHRTGLVGGAGARRNNRPRRYLEKQMSSQSSASGSLVFPVSKPKQLPRPLATPRLQAMSPHGVAMDAALKMEERGARLEILREETVTTTEKYGAQDLAYDSQIAAPAMTSLEQRRQRAKAWAKSR